MFLGLGGGIILSHIAPEELLPGKKYFRIGEYVVLLCILATLMLFLPWYWGIFLLIILSGYIVLFREERIILQRIYVTLPLLLYVLIPHSSYYAISTSVSFIWGLFRATRESIPYVKNNRIIHTKELVIRILKGYCIYWIVVITVLVLQLEFLTSWLD